MKNKNDLYEFIAFALLALATTALVLNMLALTVYLIDAMFG